MAEQGFPAQHTTMTTVTSSNTTVQVTTVTSSNTTVQTNIRFDPMYIRTVPGALKVAQIALDLLGFICITVSSLALYSRGSWFNTVAMTGFWFTGIMLAFYLFHIVEKFYRIPWLKIEFVFCAVWTFFYLLAASLAADYGSRGAEAFAAAAFFGFCAMVCYGYDAFLKFKGIRAGDLAQGQHVVTKSTSAVTSPAY